MKRRTLIISICVWLLLPGHVLAEEESPYQAEVLSKTSSSWNGSTLPDYPEGRPEVTILRITIPPERNCPFTSIR